MSERKTVEYIRDKKAKHQKITMLTAYDYPLGSLVDAAGVDMILVGDSLANVVLGLESTTEVGMSEMIHHAKAVNRAVSQALLIGDMPFESYQTFDGNHLEHQSAMRYSGDLARMARERLPKQ